MSKLASRDLVALVMLLVFSCSDEPGTGPLPYNYLGCEDEGATNCPGQKAFTCALETIRSKYNHCGAATDCVASAGPDPANCFEACEHAALNAGQDDNYLREVKTEVFKYCAQSRCIAYPFCPRPNDAVVDCTDAGRCEWVEGVFKFPDAGDAGPAVRRDGSVAPPGLDASTPPQPGLDAAAPPAGMDAAPPPGLDAAPPPGLDAAPPPGLDAAPPPGLDAAPSPGLDADTSGPDV